MYYTLQLRLKTEKSEREVLSRYEAEYVKELERLIKRMKRLKLHHPYRFYDYSQQIPKASSWALYQIADKIAIAQKEQRQGSYSRSGTWSPADYHITNDLLHLTFGEAFLPKEGIYHLAIDKQSERRLHQGKQLRLDLTHDEHFWYCNILILVKDT